MNQQKAEKFISRCPWSGSDLEVLSKTKKGLIGGLCLILSGYMMNHHFIFRNADPFTSSDIKLVLLGLSMVTLFSYYLHKVSLVKKFIIENGTQVLTEQKQPLTPNMGKRKKG